MAPYQIVTVDSSLLTVKPGEAFTLPLIYNISDGSQSTGISINIYYNSSFVTPNEATELNSSILTYIILADEDNLDNDSTTDKYFNLTFLNFAGQFPGSPLPKTIAKVSFTPSANFPNSGITLNLDAIPAQGYEFQKYPIPLTKIQAIPVNDGAATFSVSGTRTVGQVLTVNKTAADPDGDGNGTISYQWQSSSDGNTWAIIGNNAPNYTLTSAEQSKQIRVLVSYIDA